MIWIYKWMLWVCYFWIKTVNVLEAGDRDLEILSSASRRTLEFLETSGFLAAGHILQI